MTVYELSKKLAARPEMCQTCGLMRQRKDGRGGTHDVVLMDSLPSDLTGGYNGPF